MSISPSLEFLWPLWIVKAARIQEIALTMRITYFISIEVAELKENTMKAELRIISSTAIVFSISTATMTGMEDVIIIVKAIS